MKRLISILSTFFCCSFFFASRLFCLQGVLAEEAYSSKPSLFLVVAEVIKELPDSLQTYPAIEEMGEPFNFTSVQEREERASKSLFRNLLARAIDLTIQVGERQKATKLQARGMAQDLQKSLVLLCHDLYAALQGEENFSLPERDLFGCEVFQTDDREERERLAYKALQGSSEDINNFLQDLFTNLFGYYSTKLTQLHSYIYQQVATHAQDVLQEPVSIDGGSEMYLELAQQGEGDYNSYKTCYVVARSVLDRVTYRNEIVSHRENVSATLCLLTLITRIGDLAFDRSYVLKGKKELFVEHLSLLLRELHDFISADDLLESFGKISSSISEFDEIRSEEEWYAVAESFLQSPEKGQVFLEDLFSGLHLYSEEKLSDIFAEIFCQLSDAVQE